MNIAVEGSTAPDPIAVADAQSIAALFQLTAARRRDDVALRTIDDSERLTFGEFQAHAERVARGLAALGVKRGETVATMMLNQPSFFVADMATMLLGAASLAVYNTLPANEVAWTLQHANARVVITDHALLDVVQQAGAETIVLVGEPKPGTIDFSSLDGTDPVRWTDVRPDDTAVIVYTSGTTGRPKAVELTHRSILGNAQGLNEALGATDGGRSISYLPMAHMAERHMTQYRQAAYGLEVTTCPDPRRLVEHLRAVRPHYFFAPPRILEKFRQAELAGGPLETFGLDQVRVTIVGSAPCSEDLARFWTDAGLPLVEAWGLTECGALGALGRPKTYRPGMVGTPPPGVEVKLADDGEVLLRSPWMMKGYRGLPSETAAAFDGDGWLLTGDVGELDGGQLRIVDRKKDIIINSSGKNMSPLRIERSLKEASAVIEDVCVIGDGRPFVTALITTNPDAAEVGPELLALVAEAVEAANAGLARVEQVKRYLVVDGPWSANARFTTPTLKVKRQAIQEFYRSEIDALYAP